MVSVFLLTPTGIQRYSPTYLQVGIECSVVEYSADSSVGVLWCRRWICKHLIRGGMFVRISGTKVSIIDQGGGTWLTRIQRNSNLYGTSRIC